MAFTKQWMMVCAWAGVSTLAACGGGGGGGGDSTPANLDGVYVQVCQNPPTTAYSTITTLTFSGKKVAAVEDYYVGNGCTGAPQNRITYPEGSFTAHGSKTVSGKKASKIEVTTNGLLAVSGPFTDNGNGTLTVQVNGLYLTLPTTAISDVEKDVLVLEGNTLYWGDASAAVDSSGYPNSLDMYGYFNKQ